MAEKKQYSISQNAAYDKWSFNPKTGKVIREKDGVVEEIDVEILPVDQEENEEEEEDAE